VNEVAGLETVESEHVRFLLSNLASGASEATSTDLAQHTSCAELSNPLHAVARGSGVRAVIAVEQDDGQVVVLADHEDGKPREWIFTADEDGRIGAVSCGRTVDGVDFAVMSPQDLSDDEREQLQALFALAYTNPDPGYLDQQFSTMSIATIARRQGKVVGFTLGGRQQIKTDAVGAVRVNLPGLTCVDPGEHRTGIGQGMGVRTTWRQLSEFGAFEVVAPRLATPASLAMIMRVKEQFRWPHLDDLFALYDHPTPAQVELAELTSLAYGSRGYDPATGACIGHGRPIGVPNVEPDVPEDFHRRFARIDRERGDSLLYLRWMVDPPETWAATG